MERKGIQERLVLIFTIIIIFSSSVQSIGIAPPVKEVEYIPGHHEYTFKVINKDKEIKWAELQLGGVLAEYINIEETVDISNFENKINYTIDLNEPLKPGRNLGEIIVIPKFDSREEINAQPGLKYKLIVISPYPKKYLDSELYITTFEGVEFTFSLSNLGTEVLKDIHAGIEIFDNDVKIDELRTNSISLDSMERSKVTAHWIPEIEGEYELKAKLNFDKEIKDYERTFTYGNPEFKIISLDFGSYKLGEIARLDLEIKSNWNRGLNNVLIAGFIDDGEFGSVKFDIAENSKEIVSLFWDTEGYLSGEYQLTIVFPDYEISEIFNIVLSEDEIIVKGKPSLITGKVIKAEEKEPKSYYLFIIPLILIVLIVFIIFQKIKKPDQKRKLEQYINEQIKRGYDTETIKSKLISRNWPENIINEVLEKIMKK